MKKIVITGAIGYIGMELCKIYSGKSLNNKIVAIDKSFSPSQLKLLNNWNIEYKIEKTLEDLFQYWMDKIK